MKLSRTPVIAMLALSSFFYACKDKKKDDVKTSDANPSTEENSVKKEPTQPKVVLGTHNYKDLEPLNAKDLHLAWSSWIGKKVQITGYPDLFFEEDNFNSSIKLTAAPGDKIPLIEGKPEEKDETKYNRNQAITVEGTIKGKWGFSGKYTIRLTDIKVINAKAEASKSDQPIDYISVTETTPVFCQDIHDAFIGWIGKEITVKGHANGVTTSTTSYGKTVRVDLVNPKSAFDKYVGVRLKKEDSTTDVEAIKNEPKQMRVFKGTFTGTCFKMACIEEAEEIK